MTFLATFPQAEVFIETGYGWGNSLEAAWNSEMYQSLHSIEIDEGVAHDAYTRWKRYYPLVTIHPGSSPEVLSRVVVPHLSTAFWLDAHFSGGGFAQDAYHVGPQCPLLDELAVITSVPWIAEVNILIDDAHMFRHEFPEPTYRAEDWPTTEQIEAALAGWTRIESAPNDVLWFAR